MGVGVYIHGGNRILWVLSLLGFVGKLIMLMFCCLPLRTIVVVEALAMDLD
jgi:O-antigen ligase